MIHRILAATAFCGLASVPASFAQDAAAGAQAFRRCQACHVIDAETNRLGPHLVDVFERPVASVDGFKYSDPMKGYAEGGKVWDEATLDAFLADPRGVVEGTRMAFPGLKDEKQRADLIAYLKDPSAAE